MPWPFRRLLPAIALALAATGTSAADGPWQIPATGMTNAAGTFGVLSYNIEGLPWPVASGRTAAAERIAGLLRTMRLAGTQPHVVALQEAFGDAGKRIGADAGYAYAAIGPSADMAAAPADAPADRAFVADASAWSGETLGKHADSGLAIFSDYPIVWARRIAFPAYACAGWDCLANKGVLAVGVRVPGVAEPVVVIDTHLNSAGAAHVGRARTRYAYERQVATLRGFVDAVVPAGAAMVMTGDYNVGRDRTRADILAGGLFSDDTHLTVVEQSCGHDCRRVDVPARGAADPLRGVKSLVAFRAPRGAGVTPAASVGSFGWGADGRRLSDHVGLAAGFRMATRLAGPRPIA